MDHVPRSDPVPERLRIVTLARVLHRIEVRQVAEELVETVHRRQELVPVTEVVFAELAGGIAHRLQHRRDRGRLIGHSKWRTRLAHGSQASAYRQFTGDEVRTSCRAAG